MDQNNPNPAPAAPESNQPAQPVVTPTPQQNQQDDVVLDDLFADPNPSPQPTPQAAPAAPAQPVQPANAQPATPAAPAVDPTVIANQVRQDVSKSLSRQQELNSFFSSEKGRAFTPYMEQISKVAVDPRFVDLKLDRVVGLALTPDTLLKMGAKMEKEASTQAATTHTGGNGAAPQDNNQAVDYASMPEDKFMETYQRVKSGS